MTGVEALAGWAELEALIEPHYLKAGKGRQPIRLRTMLRIYFPQHSFNLSDSGAEDVPSSKVTCNSPLNPCRKSSRVLALVSTIDSIANLQTPFRTAMVMASF
jgi:hypothetical protein